MTEQSFIKKYQPCMNTLLDEKIRLYCSKVVKSKKDKELINKKRDNYIEYYNSCLSNYIDHLKSFNNTIINYRNYNALIDFAGSEDILIKDLEKTIGFKLVSKVTPTSELYYYIVEKAA